MPDEDADYARRGGRLLPALFWAGVGLAPLAGLLLLLGNGGSLRVGAFLGVLALVLIAVIAFGLWLLLRDEPARLAIWVAVVVGWGIGGLALLATDRTEGFGEGVTASLVERFGLFTIAWLWLSVVYLAHDGSLRVAAGRPDGDPSASG